jgi:FHA domain
VAACPAGHDSAATDYCDVCGMRMEVPGQGGPGGQGSGGPMTGAQATVAHVTAAMPLGQSGQLCPRCGAVRSGRFCEGCGLDLDAPMPPASAMAAMPVPSPAAPPAEPSAVTGPDPGISTGGAGPGTGAPSYGTASRPGASTGGAAAYGAGGEQPAAPDPAGPASWSVAATADRAYYDSVTSSGGPDAALVTFPPYCPERRFALTGREMRIGRRSASRGLTPEIDLTGPPLDPGISRLHAVLIADPVMGWSVIDPGSENGTIVNGKEIPTGVPVPLHDGDRIHLGAWTLITVSQANSGQK